MSWTFDRILRGARKFKASDVHLLVGMAPAIRVGGHISILEGAPLTHECLVGMLDHLLNDEQQKMLREDWQICFSRNWPEVGRFRASVYRNAETPEFAIRICETTVRQRDELGLPEKVDELARLTTGLILITGPTGVGKTTTLNYIIDLINQDRRAKIITIEDPIEYVHERRRSIIVQQEVGTDVKSFRKALLHALRQDPDVIVVGEMRDLETMETTLTAAETGHLVLATLHTPDAVQTIQRIYSVFPADQQNHIVTQLSNSLQAILVQRLLPQASGKGRVLATELCLATPAVRSHIREKEAHLLFNELQTGRRFGRHTMDHSLLDLYQRGEITYDTAVSCAREPESIRQRSA
ncbi:MAG: PilT/PilU family type 4a pilus ATPase [Planctomycetota bacterium]